MSRNSLKNRVDAILVVYNGFVIRTSKLSLWRLKESRATRNQPLLNQMQPKFLI